MSNDRPAPPALLRWEMRRARAARLRHSAPRLAGALCVANGMAAPLALRPGQPPRVSGPYRSLAARVIDQALRDAENPAGSPETRAGAREFLEGSSMLYFWCALAELDPGSLILGAKALLSAERRMPARTWAAASTPPRA